MVRILSFTAWKSGSRDRGHGSTDNPRDGFYMASDFGGEGGILNGAKPGTDIPLLSILPPPEIGEGVIDQGEGKKSRASPQTVSIIIVHQI